MIQNSTYPKTGPSNVFSLFVRAWVEGPTKQPLVPAKSKHSFSFLVCPQQSCCLFINSGRISGPKGTQFYLMLNSQTDDKTDPFTNTTSRSQGRPKERQVPSRLSKGSLGGGSTKALLRQNLIFLNLAPDFDDPKDLFGSLLGTFLKSILDHPLRLTYTED